MKRIQASTWIKLSSKKNGKKAIIALCEEQKRVIVHLETLKARATYHTLTNSPQSLIDELNESIRQVKERYTELSLIIKEEKIKCLNAS